MKRFNPKQKADLDELFDDFEEATSPSFCTV